MAVLVPGPVPLAVTCSPGAVGVGVGDSTCSGTSTTTRPPVSSGLARLVWVDGGAMSLPLLLPLLLLPLLLAEAAAVVVPIPVPMQELVLVQVELLRDSIMKVTPKPTDEALPPAVVNEYWSSDPGTITGTGNSHTVFSSMSLPVHTMSLDDAFRGDDSGVCCSWGSFWVSRGAALAASKSLKYSSGSITAWLYITKTNRNYRIADDLVSMKRTVSAQLSLSTEWKWP